VDWSLLERDLIGSIWTSPNLERTLAHLCDLCGGRFAGTSDERRAADFMRAQFSAWGLSEARLEPFEMRGWRRGPARLTLMAGDQVTKLPCIALAGSPPGEAEAELVDVGPGTPADFERLGETIVGKAVLASAEGPHRLEKYARAQAAGAALFLFANSRPGMLLPAGSLSLGNKAVELPGLGLSLETTSFLRRQLKQGSVHVRGAVEGGPHRVTAHNVIGELPGSDPNAGWIVACGHYDGHDIAQGAQDNATGTAVILEAARTIAPLQAHLKAGIRFILFSGEEMGMYGSAAYVREHPAELDSIRMVFNADIVGLAAPLNLMVQNSPELLAYLDRLPLEEIGAQANGSRLVPYSDHFSFTLVGIASLMAVTSSPGPGQGWAHTAADTLDKLDLRNVREAAVSTARILLRMAIDPQGLPAQRQAPESIVQALTAAGIDEPMRVRGEWPFA
jgi:Zn-dependent M28 family amino/carboxypeptidase